MFQIREMTKALVPDQKHPRLQRRPRRWVPPRKSVKGVTSNDPHSCIIAISYILSRPFPLPEIPSLSRAPSPSIPPHPFSTVLNQLISARNRRLIQPMLHVFVCFRSSSSIHPMEFRFIGAPVFLPQRVGDEFIKKEVDEL